MANWPGTLPASPLLSSYRERVQSPALRTQMDTGPDKVRNRNSNVPTKASFAFHMTTAQVQIFEDLWEDTLKRGSVTVDNFTHPRKNIVVTMRVKGIGEMRPVSDTKWLVPLEVEFLP